jgi:shikimate kinase/3-dehydroquinate synthase
MRPLVLSGPMGAGKSTVARIVAQRTGASLVDVDQEIEESAGRPVHAIFADEGEHGFRAREAEAIERIVDQAKNMVISVGGGAVTRERTRRALLRRAIVITLEADVKTLVERAAKQGLETRPLLSSDDPVGSMRVVLDARAVAYAESHARVDTSKRTPDEVANEVIAIWNREPVAVPLGSRSYRVEIGRGVIAQLRSIDAALVVTDDRVWPAVSSIVEPSLARRGALLVLPAGEAHKTIASIERIWDAALEAKIDRSSTLLAVGGGVVGDLVGFAASTLLRGVRFVQVPTTLLAMVDASVGGKTAIDRPQGKNLVGAFHQPSLVVADVDLLRTLPPREMRSGLAEVVKTALVGDASLLDAIEANVDAISKNDLDVLVPLVRASVAHKARVVSEDERDVTGARAALNFGHTVGHALEAHGGYTALTHGEAVALGTIAALRVGVALGVTSRALLDRTTRLLAALGLPVALDARTLEAALPRVLHDKKRVGAAIDYVLVPESGRAVIRKLTLDELTRALGVGAGA